MERLGEILHLFLILQTWIIFWEADVYKSLTYFCITFNSLSNVSIVFMNKIFYKHSLLNKILFTLNVDKTSQSTCNTDSTEVGDPRAKSPVVTESTDNIFSVIQNRKYCSDRNLERKLTILVMNRVIKRIRSDNLVQSWDYHISLGP